jgi:hypothetical protein
VDFIADRTASLRLLRAICRMMETPVGIRDLSSASNLRNVSAARPLDQFGQHPLGSAALLVSSAAPRLINS